MKENFTGRLVDYFRRWAVIPKDDPKEKEHEDRGNTDRAPQAGDLGAALADDGASHLKQIKTREQQIK